jgi:hypothetical protein
MTLHLPDDAASSHAITASTKLVLAFTISNPLASKKEAATALGMSRSSLFKALADLKKKGVATSPPEWTVESPRVDYSLPESTPHPSRVCKGSGGSGGSPVKSSTPKAASASPTQEEVQGYAAGKGREDLAADFFEKYDADRWTVNGEAMTSWRKMFDGWARRRPKPTQAARRKRTLEDALYDVDKTY